MLAPTSHLEQKGDRVALDLEALLGPAAAEHCFAPVAVGVAPKLKDLVGRRRRLSCVHAQLVIVVLRRAVPVEHEIEVRGARKRHGLPHLVVVSHGVRRLHNPAALDHRRQRGEAAHKAGLAPLYVERRILFLRLVFALVSSPFPIVDLALVPVRRLDRLEGGCESVRRPPRVDEQLHQVGDSAIALRAPNVECVLVRHAGQDTGEDSAQRGALH